MKCQAGFVAGSTVGRSRFGGPPGSQVVGRELSPSGEELIQPVSWALAERRPDIGQPVVVAELHHRVGPVRPSRELGVDAVIPETTERGGQVIHRSGRRRLRPS